MDGTGAVLPQQLIVELGAVSLVLLKLVLRVLLRRLDHPPVPAHLGQNGGRRNGGGAAVPLYKTAVVRNKGEALPAVPVAVNEGDETLIATILPTDWANYTVSTAWKA